MEGRRWEKCIGNVCCVYVVEIGLAVQEYFSSPVSFRWRCGIGSGCLRAFCFFGWARCLRWVCARFVHRTSIATEEVFLLFLISLGLAGCIAGYARRVIDVDWLGLACVGCDCHFAVIHLATSTAGKLVCGSILWWCVNQTWMSSRWAVFDTEFPRAMKNMDSGFFDASTSAAMQPLPAG